MAHDPNKGTVDWIGEAEESLKHVDLDSAEDVNALKAQMEAQMGTPRRKQQELAQQQFNPPQNPFPATSSVGLNDAVEELRTKISLISDKVDLILQLFAARTQDAVAEDESATEGSEAVRNSD